MQTLIGVPVTEKGVGRLSRRLAELARRYGSIALPLPQSICVRVVTGSLDALEYALSRMGPANFRIWGNLLIALRDLSLDYPDVEVGCYASDETYAASEARGYAIAILTAKARAFNIVKPEEWLRIFEKLPPKTIVDRVAGYNAVVADGYSWMVRLRDEIKPKKLLVVDTMIPTPLDVLELMALGYLDASSVREVIEYAVKYVGEYIMTSFTLTQAYNKLLNDKGYLELLKRLKLKIYKLRGREKTLKYPPSIDFL